MFSFFLCIFIPTFKKDILERCVKEGLDSIEVERCKTAIQDLFKEEHRTFRLEDPLSNYPNSFRPPIVQAYPFFLIEQ